MAKGREEVVLGPIRRLGLAAGCLLAGQEPGSLPFFRLLSGDVTGDGGESNGFARLLVPDQEHVEVDGEGFAGDEVPEPKFPFPAATVEHRGDDRVLGEAPLSSGGGGVEEMLNLSLRDAAEPDESQPGPIDMNGLAGERGVADEVDEFSTTETSRCRSTSPACGRRCRGRSPTIS